MTDADAIRIAREYLDKKEDERRRKEDGLYLLAFIASVVVGCLAIWIVL